MQTQTEAMRCCLCGKAGVATWVISLGANNHRLADLKRFSRGFFALERDHGEVQFQCAACKAALTPCPQQRSHSPAPYT